jgi:putative acetyltransferase
VTRSAQLRVRPERAGDGTRVFELHARAFQRPAEAELVDALRDAGALTLSLVAEAGGRRVGHVAFSPVHVGEGAAAWQALALGPLAVDPDHQNGGVGSALVREGLERCRADRHAVVFVLGHSRYYPRFGFEPAAARGFAYEGGARFAPAFYVAELEPGAIDGRSGVVRYRPEFASV